MKLALAHAYPVALNVERTWLAVAVLFAVLIARRGPLLPTNWRAVIVTGFFQTTLNFASTTMAPAGTASLNMFAIPVIALLASMAIFGERLGSAEWTGIACIGVGLVIVTARAWRAARYGERAPPEPTPLEGG